MEQYKAKREETEPAQSENPWEQMASEIPDFEAEKTEREEHDPLELPEDLETRIDENENLYSDLLLSARKAQTVSYIVEVNRKHDMPILKVRAANLGASDAYPHFLLTSDQEHLLSQAKAGEAASREAREIVLKNVIDGVISEKDEKKLPELLKTAKDGGAAADKLQPDIQLKRDYDWLTGTDYTEHHELLQESADLLAHTWNEDDYEEAKDLTSFLERELKPFEATEENAPEDAKNGNIFHFIEKPINLKDRVKLLVAQEKLNEQLEKYGDQQ